MNYSLSCDKREYARVEKELPTEFKFLGNEPNFSDIGKIFTGTITSISGGGLRLVGPLSNRAWIPRFIWQKIIVGVRFTLPGSDRPVVALCRVAWIEDDDKEGSDDVQFGLMMKEISNTDKDRIFDFVIHSYME